jgi:hypothetical protein
MASSGGLYNKSFCSKLVFASKPVLATDSNKNTGIICKLIGSTLRSRLRFQWPQLAPEKENGTNIRKAEGD